MTSILSSRQVETLHRKLEEERDRILVVLQATAPTATQADQVTEVEEAAQRTTEATLDLEIEARERPLLAEVERALRKFDRGGYGVGERSGLPIPYERLVALPWARDAMGE
jgi:RNA polymerase-binding transcription factor DksA